MRIRKFYWIMLKWCSIEFWLLSKTYNSVLEKKVTQFALRMLLTHWIESYTSLSHIHMSILCDFKISLGFNQIISYILHFNIKKSSHIRIIKQKSLELPFDEICSKAKLNFSTIRSFYIARENKRLQINFDLMPKVNFKFWVSVWEQLPNKMFLRWSQW